MDISIVGCGFAGMSSALFLAKMGHNIVIYDKFSHVQAVGAGLILQPSSRPVLASLGILEIIESHGEVVERLCGINHKKQELFSTSYRDWDKDSYGIGIHRSVLFNALYKKCLEQKNISFKLGEEITDVFSGKYDLLIISNGSHSQLRSQLPIKQKATTYPYGCIWTNLEDSSSVPNYLQQYVRYSEEMFGILPSGKIDGKRHVSVFWSLPVSQARSYSLEDIYTKMAAHYDNGLINRLRDCKFNFATYTDVVMERYHHKNIVVIGDAAHGMSPQLGQGANMALIDSYILGQCLSRSFDGMDLEDALKTYTQLRKPHLRFYSQASRFLTPLFQSSSTMCGLLRDAMFLSSKWVPYSKKLTSHVLCGKRTGWLNGKEITY